MVADVWPGFKPLRTHALAIVQACVVAAFTACTFLLPTFEPTSFNIHVREVWRHTWRFSPCLSQPHRIAGIHAIVSLLVRLTLVRKWRADTARHR